jgi:hypothetical protein
MQLAFVRLRIDTAVDAAAAWMRDNAVSTHWTEVKGDGLAGALRAAFPYVCTPFDLTAFVEVSGEWTMVAGNSAIGGDVTACVSCLSRIARTTSVLVHWTPSVGRMSPSAAYLRFDAGVLVRSVHLAREGKWRLSSAGSALAFEEIDTYEKARGAQKLTRPMLLRYLEADGIALHDGNGETAARVVRDTSEWTRTVEKVPLAQRRVDLQLVDK